MDAPGVLALMKNVKSLIPRISARQSDVLREKLSHYVASLLEKNAARLSKYEKAQQARDVHAE